QKVPDWRGQGSPASTPPPCAMSPNRCMWRSAKPRMAHAGSTASGVKPGSGSAMSSKRTHELDEVPKTSSSTVSVPLLPQKQSPTQPGTSVRLAAYGPDVPAAYSSAGLQHARWPAWPHGDGLWQVRTAVPPRQLQSPAHPATPTS